MAATVDGVPIELEHANWNGQIVVVRTVGHGTFAATNTGDDAARLAAVRRYLEHRPAEGYAVSIVDRAAVANEHRFTIKIDNRRLTERADVWLSAQVMGTLARGAEVPADVQIERQIAETIRHDRWQLSAPKT